VSVITAEGTNLTRSKTFVTGAATYREQETVTTAASVFGSLVNICKSKNISLAVKIGLHESLVI